MAVTGPTKVATWGDTQGTCSGAAGGYLVSPGGRIPRVWGESPAAGKGPGLQAAHTRPGQHRGAPVFQPAACVRAGRGRDVVLRDRGAPAEGGQRETASLRRQGPRRMATRPRDSIWTCCRCVQGRKGQRAPFPGHLGRRWGRACSMAIRYTPSLCLSMTRGPPWRLSDHWQWALKMETESPSHPAAGEGRVLKAWGAHDSPECGFVLGDREATPAGAAEAHGFGRLGGM